MLPLSLSTDLPSELFHFLTSNPITLFLIPVVWFAILGALQYGLDILITPYWGIMSLIVAVLLVIGIAIVYVS